MSTRTATIGREVVQRGEYSCYVAVDRDWLHKSGVDADTTARLEKIGQSDRSVRLRLYIGQDYGGHPDPPGMFDVEFVDVRTAVQWSIPAGIRKLHGIDGEFTYNSEFKESAGVVDYEVVSPAQHREMLLK